MFDMNHPFFRPLWRRIAMVGVASGWALVEAISGSPGWALGFAALGAYSAWTLFITFDPGKDEP